MMPARSLAPLIIVGMGGFGFEVVTLVDAINRDEPTWTVAGFLDDDPRLEALAKARRMGISYLGAVDDSRCGRLGLGTETACVVAVGSGTAREALVARLPAGTHFPTLVHPVASLGLDVTLGEGTVLAAGARVTTNVVTGRHTHIDQNVTLAHDCELGNYVRLNPSSTVSGDVRIGHRVLVGANATVLQGLSLGQDCVVGAGAVVTRDVPEGATAVGLPARWRDA